MSEIRTARKRGGKRIDVIKQNADAAIQQDDHL